MVSEAATPTSTPKLRFLDETLTVSYTLLTQLHIHKWLKVQSQNRHSFPATAIRDSCLASSKGS